jgi:hypothetical protein
MVLIPSVYFKNRVHTIVHLLGVVLGKLAEICHCVTSAGEHVMDNRLDFGIALTSCSSLNWDNDMRIARVGRISWRSACAQWIQPSTPCLHFLTNCHHQNLQGDHTCYTGTTLTALNHGFSFPMVKDLKKKSPPQPSLPSPAPPTAKDIGHVTSSGLSSIIGKSYTVA